MQVSSISIRTIFGLLLPTPGQSAVAIVQPVMLIDLLETAGVQTSYVLVRGLVIVTHSTVQFVGLREVYYHGLRITVTAGAGAGAQVSRPSTDTLCTGGAAYYARDLIGTSWHLGGLCAATFASNGYTDYGSVRWV